MSDKDMERAMEARARDSGGDVIGIASIDRFTYAPEEYHPQRYLSDARSVIVIGTRISRGITMVQKNQTAYLPYDMFGHAWLGNISANLIALHVARLIEDYGYHAVPLPATTCEEGWTQSTDGWAGEQYIAFAHCAVAAGLGEFGWHRMLLTPQFGPRLRLVVVITDALMKPTPLYNARLCEPEDCGYRCVKACPVNTLKTEQDVPVKIANREYTYASFNALECMWVTSGLNRETCTFAPLDIKIPENLSHKMLIAYKKLFYSLSPAYDKYKLAFSKSAFCGNCLIACCEYLEDKEKVKNQFARVSP